MVPPGVLHGGTTFVAGGSLPNLSRLDVRGTANWDGDLSIAGKAMNFYLPTTMTAGGKMLDVSGTADITGSTVNVGISGSSSPLRTGDTVILVDADTLIGAPVNSTTSGQGMLGVTLLYDFDITTNPTASQLLATVSSSGSGPRINPQTKALSEGFVSGMALATQGGDTLAGPGMNNAVSAAKSTGAGTAPALVGFGALSGGSMRFNSGSHVDMRSVSLLAGLAYGADINPGRLTLGAFFEYGSGSYDTYNSFSNAASVKGTGDTWYIGGGILGHMSFVDTGPGHFYTEGSFRAGRLHNEYNNSDLRDFTGRSAGYESSSNYYSFHLGTGYVWNFTDKASFDIYGKYFWTRLQGDSVTLSTGEQVNFKDTNSSRLRGGGRLTYAINEHVSPYIGAAYEREFDGKARATTNGFDIPAPSLRGNTGIGEFGLTLKPSLNLPLSFDLGVQGYTGKREGVTGSLQIRYEF